MTRRKALVILLLGVLLLLGSCVPLGQGVWQALSPEIAATTEVDPASGISGEPYVVEPGADVRIAYQLRVSTTSVQERVDDDEDGFEARYHLPARVTVRGTDGAILSDESRPLDWRRRDSELLHSVSDGGVGVDGGTVTIDFTFPAFAAPMDGRILVDAGIGTDEEYHATVESMTLSVQHGLRDVIFLVVLGVSLAAFGVITTLLGFIFVVSQYAGSSGIDGDGVASSDADARRIAMACHLSGFAGYLIPFGSLVVPVVVWLVNRRSHPYIDEQGREAVNFQLSLFVYMLLCLALVLAMIGVLLLPLLALWHVIFMIIAAVRASEGEAFRYPMIVRFVR